MIRIANLYKAFGTQRVVAGANIEIPTGALYAVISRSGAGKSCLLKLLIALMQPDAGEVWVEDTEVTHLRGRALNQVRNCFGRLFQGGALFDSFSVYDNVAFPLREKTRLREIDIRQKVWERLAQGGLTGVEKKFPTELSGGMRKLVAVARAIISEPEILPFDEPTTGPDPIRVNSIHHLVHDLHGILHFTAVIVTHEIPQIFFLATQVSMLHEGVIVATGTPAAFQSSPNPVVQQTVHSRPQPWSN